MKFNYKDKSQIPDNNINGNAPSGLNEVENINVESKNEVQLDMPSFEDFLNNETPSFNDFTNNTGTKDSMENMFSPDTSFDISDVNIPEPEIDASTSKNTNQEELSDFGINPIFSPIPDDIKNDRTGLEPDNSKVENYKEIDFSNNTFEPELSFNDAPMDVYEPEVEKSLPKDVISHEVNDFDANPVFSPIPDDIKNDKTGLEIDTPEIPEVKDYNEVDFNKDTSPIDFYDEQFSDSTPATPNMVDDTKLPSLEKSTDDLMLDTNTTMQNEELSANSNGISLDEIFDPTEIKKEKKSLFGKKKEKVKKEKPEKAPKEKKSLFGKRNKKSEMLNKLDEIAQTETDNMSSDLLSGYGLAVEQPPKQEDTFGINDSVVSENKTTNTEIPSVLLENEIGPLSSPNEPELINTEEVIPPSFSDLNTQSQNTEISSPEFSYQPGLDNASSLDIGVDTAGLEPNKKKKKINPLIFIVIAIVILAIILSIMLFTKLFGNSKPANHIPETTPAVQENQETVDLDEDTVNSLVEETQDIVNNANDVANTYEENNELPPQVGVDIDDEIQTENAETTPSTKVFANKEITFVYPAEWTEINSFNVRETSENVTNVIMLGETPLDVEDTNNMRITVEKTITSITAKDYLAKTEEVMKTSFTNIKTRKSAELTIAGREAPSRIYTFNDESGNSIEQFQVYVANAQDIYVITFTSSEENFAKNLDTYKEILKTIQIN